MVSTRKGRSNSNDLLRLEDEEELKDRDQDKSGNLEIIIDRTGDHSAGDATKKDSNHLKDPENEDDQAGDTSTSKHAKGSKEKKKKQEKNELTKLLPGYTAPLCLNTSSLDKFRPAGGIRELQRRAERTDASTKAFVAEASSKHVQSMVKAPNGLLPTSYASAYSSFKKGKKRAPDTSAGKGWFGMQPTLMTEELKTDLAVIRNRNYLDPKKFYKNPDKPSDIVQVGTVIEGAAEFYSSRLTKKQRRNNLTEEFMADPDTADYVRKKFKEFSREKSKQTKKEDKETKTPLLTIFGTSYCAGSGPRGSRKRIKSVPAILWPRCWLGLLKPLFGTLSVLVQSLHRKK